MADEKTSKSDVHSPEEIRGFLQRNYTGLGGSEDMSIGMVGNNYRVAVVDKFKVIHTFNIDPKDINAEKLRMAAANRAAARLTASPKPDTPKSKHRQQR